jgi:hypothetical protein
MRSQPNEIRVARFKSPFLRTTVNRLPSGENIAVLPIEGTPRKYPGSARVVISMQSATDTRTFSVVDHNGALANSNKNNGNFRAV